MCIGDSLAQSASACIEYLARDNESVIGFEGSIGTAVFAVALCTDRGSVFAHDRSYGAFALT